MTPQELLKEIKECKEKFTGSQYYCLYKEDIDNLIPYMEEKDKEIERLNNIINEIYTFLSQYTITHTWQKVVIEDTIRYIDELKGSESNE